MRIQHNIAAMNSYRNYNNNVKAVNKNLEKLSSGYKVNRAGDDAAGLAISEKMRAQITGLNAAQKNVKDGVSLVKTAEGAMQEIQDMLNRMDYLATQSANGTYDNEVDRDNLNKEVNALKTEINRIADSANFNGIKLLDGSLASGSTKAVDTLLKTFAKDADGKWIDPQDVNATTAKFTTKGFSGAPTSLTEGDLIEVSFDIKDTDGNVTTTKVTLKAEIKNAAGKTFNLVDENGRVMGSTTDDKPDAATIGKAVVKYLKDNTDLDETFKIDMSGDEIEFEAYAPGKTLEVVGVNASTTTEKAKNSGTGNDGSTSSGWIDMQLQVDKDVAKITVGEDKTYAFDLTKLDAANGVWDGKAKNLEDAILELDGHKFMFVAAEDSISLSNSMIDQMTAAGVEGFVQIKTGKVATGITGEDIKAMVQEMRQATGLNIQQGTNNGGVFTAGEATGDKSIRILNDKNGKGTTGTGGLRLQIADTADKFNQMTVAIGDMHTKAMGTGKTTIDGKEVNVTKTVSDIDISNQDGAAEAIGIIKNAINYVSSIRGDLGAVQNRLEHTQNNLSVMTENIQDAESTIRDTDVADEMMSYTKNNILIQSAQAMLAQANQIPQGVLQLLG